jgi:4-amino-4-deoxy-L-arabinose transferase-like glycosyltransferase
VRGFLWDHNVGRAARSLEGHSGSLLYYYPLALLVGFFPWSVFAVPVAWEAVAQLRRQGPARTCLVLSLSWISVYIGLFSLAQTKLPSYITPCYPAVALLVSVFIRAWCTRTTVVSRRWQAAALVCLAIVSLGMLVAIPILIPRYLPGEMGLLGLAAIPLLTAAGGLWCLRRDRTRPAAVTCAVGACALCGTLFAVGAARVDRHQTFDTLVAYLEEQGPAAEVGTLGVSEPSWVFYLGRPLDRLYAPPPDAQAAARPAPTSHTTATPSLPVRAGTPPLQKPAQDAWQYLREQPRRYAITSQGYLQSVGGPPEGIEIVARTPYFLRSDTLLLLAARWWAPP